MTNQKQKSKIPTFKSLQEEAEFWDTHDFTDFLDETKPIEVKVSLPKKPVHKSITVRFATDALEEIRNRAHSRGIGATTLIRMWVLDRLRGRTASTL